jgi:hypothetical protein
MSRPRLGTCRVTTGLAASPMVSGGVARVRHVPASVDGFVRLGYPLHSVTLAEHEALAEGGHPVLAGVPDPLRARLQRRSH